MSRQILEPKRHGGEKMKKAWGFCLVLLFLMATGALAFENEPEGFRGLKWGDPPTEDMVWDSTYEYGLSLYTLPDEKESLKLGNIALSSISYSFYGTDKRFGKARLSFSEELDYLMLRELCRVKFGEPMEESRATRYCIWVGEIAKVSLVHYSPLKIGYLELGNNKMLLEYEDAKKKGLIEETEGDW